MRLDGARVLLTGAGSGIGRALALGLAAQGARLVLAGRRQDALQETAGLIAAAGGDHAVHIIATDIALPDRRQALVAGAIQALGGLDILINNAGQVPVGSLEALAELEIAEAFLVNVLAPYGLVRAALPALRQSKGRVVMVGSMFGEIAFPLFVGYSASKFALRGMADALRRELAPDGIGVTHVAPRATRTPAAERFAALEKGFGMTVDSPERVAALILRAIRKDSSRVRPGLAESVFALIQAIAPGMIDRALVKQLAAIQASARIGPSKSAIKSPK